MNISHILLGLVSIVWGASYVLTKICLEYTSTYQLIFYRFFIAFVITGLIYRKNIFPIKKIEIFYSSILSIVLFLVFVTMTEGLKYTTASNAGFLVSLSVIFIPIFSYFINREAITLKNIILILSSTYGIYLISVKDSVSIQYGDLLSLLCAVLFALHVSLAGNFTKKCNSITLSVFQFGFTSLYSFIFWIHSSSMKRDFDEKFLISLLFLSIFSTALGYVLQLISQKNVSSITTAIILATEPIFSSIFAYFILIETLTPKHILGGAILLVSALVMEIKMQSIKSIFYKNSSY